MQCRFIVLSLLMVMGVFASLQSCATPTYDDFNGWYNYIDGLNSTDVNVGTYDVSGQTIAPSDLANMGATGMTKVYAMHYMEADYDRGAAYLFYDSTVSKYYVVWQWSMADKSANQIYGIPSLSKRTEADITYYWSGGTYDSPIEYFHFADATNFTRVVAMRTIDTARYIDLLKFGVSTTTGWMRRNSDGFLYDTDTSVVEGLSTISLTGGTIGYVRVNVGNNTTEISTYVMALTDYYSCANTSGIVTFNAYEGSTTCGAFGEIPAVTCAINGASYTINATNSTNQNLNYSTPEFFDASDMGTYYEVHPINQKTEYAQLGSGDIGFRKYKLDPSSLTTVLETPFYSTEDGNPRVAYIAPIGYASPTGTTDGLSAATTSFDSTIDIGGLSCYNYLFSPDRYNVTLYHGMNNTNYRKTVFTCDAGTTTTTTTYNASLANLMTANEYVLAQQITSSCPSCMDAVWISDSFIGRFQAVFMENVGRGKPVGEVSVKDEASIQYQFQSQQYSSNSSASLAYGTYFYQCSTADADYQVVNGSGYVTVASPVQFVSVALQKQVQLGLKVRLLRQDSPQVGWSCVATTSSGNVMNYSDSTGVVSFANVPVSSTVQMTCSKGLTVRSATFPIGDYYNSPDPLTGQTYGTGSSMVIGGEPTSCSNFQSDSTYYYAWDVETQDSWFYIQTRDGKGASLGNVALYWDGALIGKTDIGGNAKFSVSTDFVLHNLTGSITGFLNKSALVSLPESPYVMSLVKTSDDTGSTTGNLDMVTDFGGVTGAILSPFMLSLIVIGGVLVVVYVVTQALAIAAICAILACIALVTFGVLPLWFGIIIILIAAAAAYVLFFSG